MAPFGGRLVTGIKRYRAPVVLAKHLVRYRGKVDSLSLSQIAAKLVRDLSIISTLAPYMVFA